MKFDSHGYSISAAVRIVTDEDTQATRFLLIGLKRLNTRTMSIASSQSDSWSRHLPTGVPRPFRATRMSCTAPSAYRAGGWTRLIAGEE
jgi:hypothetical protein